MFRNCICNLLCINDAVCGEALLGWVWRSYGIFELISAGVNGLKEKRHSGFTILFSKTAHLEVIEHFR